MRDRSGKEKKSAADTQQRTLNIALFSSLFPNSSQPRLGIFVQERLRHLIESQDIEAKVVAPVPWFPASNSCYGQFGLIGGIPERESLNNIDVYHPRYFSIPAIGKYFAPLAMAVSGYRMLRRLQSSGFQFDLIDAHYFYPDGVAAVLLGRWLHTPVVITARGSDINLFPEYRIPRKYIEWAVQRASMIIAVSNPLKTRLIALGAEPARVRVLRNGVDLGTFKPVERSDLRDRLGIKGKMLLAVGNLVKLKGIDLIITALSSLPDCTLVVVGEGEERSFLERLCSIHTIGGRVIFAGNMPQQKLREYYSAADILVLASSSEGWPNVLLEAIACGTPVVATRVGGTPEIVTSACAGLLVDDRTPEELSRAIRKLLDELPDATRVRKHAEAFDWGVISRQQREIFEKVTIG